MSGAREQVALAGTRANYPESVGRALGHSGSTPRSEDRPTEAGLDLLRVLGWLVLHDVAAPGAPLSRIDHLLAGPSGIYVINTVSWKGPLPIVDGRPTAAAAAGAAAMSEVSAAAAAVRRLLGDAPVAPVLCLVRHESLVGVIDDVALCSTENVLDLLTGQPQLLDPAAVRELSRRLNTGLIPVAVPLPEQIGGPAPAAPPAPAQPKHRHSTRLPRSEPTTLTVAPAPAVPAELTVATPPPAPVAAPPSPVVPPATVPEAAVPQAAAEADFFMTAVPPVPAPIDRRLHVRSALPGRARWQTVWVGEPPVQVSAGPARKALAWLPALGRRGYVAAFLTALIGAAAVSALPMLTARSADPVAVSSGPIQLGTTVPVSATAAHPAAAVTAAQVVSTQVTGGTAPAPGQHLVAVRVRIANRGAAGWNFPAAARIAAVDTSGVTHFAATGVRSVAAGPLLSGVTRIGVNGTVTGYVPVAIPDGTAVSEVRIFLGGPGLEPVSWVVAH